MAKLDTRSIDKCLVQWPFEHNGSIHKMHSFYAVMFTVEHKNEARSRNNVENSPCL